MKIYPSEIKAGLEKKILGQTSFAYTSKLEPQDKELDLTRIKDFLAIASKDETKYGLHPMKSLLASSVWNLNDDVLLPGEIWSSRNTPNDKPVDWNHNQEHIIGHIVSSYVVDQDMKLVEDEAKVAECEKIHVITNSVLYTEWYSEAKKIQCKEMLEKIAKGELYVSMEAVFREFDYALRASDGSAVIVPRNDETSWMTAHLAIYGGSGNVLNYKIGRVPRNFSFNGVGIVEEPANPESVIFSKKVDFNTSTSNMVSIIHSELKREIIMSMTQEQFDAAKAEFDAKKLELEKKVSELTEALANKDEVVKELEATKSTLNAVIAEKDTLAKEVAEVNSKLKLIEAEKVLANRVSLVISKLSFTEDEAKEFANDLSELTQEKFEKLVNAQAEKFVKKEVKKEEPVVVKEEPVSQVVASVLDNVEKTPDVAVATAGVLGQDANAVVEAMKNYFKNTK